MVNEKIKYEADTIKDLLEDMNKTYGWIKDVNDLELFQDYDFV